MGMVQHKMEIQRRPNVEQTSVEKEQRVVDAIVQQLPERKSERSASLRQARRRAMATGDAAQGVIVAYCKALLHQIERMENGMPPYFARVVGRFRTSDGTLFEEEVRVHAFPYLEEWNTPEGPVTVVSQQAGIAAVVRDPTIKEYELNEADPRPGGAVRQGRVEPVDVRVEDIEIRDGRVVSVSDRYGEVWQERVKGKLAEAGKPEAEFLWEVLDPEQGRIINERPEGYHALLIDGPAGTGKTLIALHYVAVHARARKGARDAEQEPAHVWFIVPTSTLARRMSPAVQMGAPADLNWRVASIWDLVKALVPELPETMNGFDWAETELAGLKARDDAFVDAVVRAYRANVRRSLQDVQRYLHHAAAIVAGSPIFLETPQRVDRLSIRVRGKEVPLREAIEGLPDDPAFRQTAHAIFGVLAERVKNDPVAAAFLRKEQLDRLLDNCDTNLWKAYRDGAATYRHTRGLHQSGPHRLRVEDLGPLLAAACRIGCTLSWPAPQWVILDEMQSFSPMVLRALRTLLPVTCRLVLAGDLNQRLVREGGIRSDEEALDALGLQAEAVRRVRLTRSYRTPPEILKHAHRLLRPKEPPDINPLHPDPGEVITRVVTQGHLVREVVHDIRQAHHDGLSMIAVLCPDLPRARVLMEAVQRELEAEGNHRPQLLTGAEPYQGGLAFGPIEAFQGLEADVAIITDVTDQSFPDDPSGWGRRRLYTAVTRARKRAVILAVRAPSQTLWECQQFVEKCARIADEWWRTVNHQPRKPGQEEHSSGLPTKVRRPHGIPGPVSRDARARDAAAIRPSPILGLKHRPVFLPFACPSFVAGVVEPGHACFAGAEDWESPPFTVEPDNGDQIVLVWAYRRFTGTAPFELEVLDPKGRPLAVSGIASEKREDQGVAMVTIRHPGAYRLRVRARGIAWAVVAGGWKDE